jgi:hypothetical protein
MEKQDEMAFAVIRQKVHLERKMIFPILISEGDWK